MSDGSLWYFAYGSNMSDAVLRKRRHLTPLAARPGILHGYRLVFTIPVGPGERGVANLETAAGERTCGVLYLLAPADCERLDRSEGVHVGLYCRLAVEVQADGAPCPAFAYQSSFCDRLRKPSARYLRLLLEGARRHGLPGDWVRFLEALPLAHDEREA